MALDPKALMALEIPAVRRAYDWRDCAIYALGLGYGEDPLDQGQLRYVVETGQQAMPAMVNVLGHDGSWMKRPETGIDYLRVVHGEQEMRLHRPLPVSGEIVARTVIEEVVDKGEAKGALVTARREVSDAMTGDLVATVWMTIFCRGVGGFCGNPDSSRTPHPLPEGAPAKTVSVATSPQSALIYRLSGDYNLLHADPEVAAKAGFDRPILHGLATFGIVCRMLMAEFCGADGTRVAGLQGRFSAPVYPGEIITIDIWPEAPGRAAYRARAGERDVLRNGRFDYHP
ncbi:MaoC/PaaZ C-terminal domain-containing protein [Roseibium aggregatum]|uniref:MaoC family dehydratase N-terminal domain-containing protein n=1 Tax=Roseibium aggregatum TaxID=187304 RepID=A0A939EFH0_9HYPH|nr:MaoC/PaaZ C-terminal domain-containing protein [Roseibium aggregatum]MBN9670825.1 MaoC family dehydratase N-terminal domain-containing protein [Roseibium aggregatum]